MTRRGMTSIGLALTVALLLTGCLSMPTGGPVVETHSDGGVNRDPGFNINPKPPQPGDTPAEIVRGFLDAMTATPIQPNTAKEFLTADAAASWRPEHETITYAQQRKAFGRPIGDFQHNKFLLAELVTKVEVTQSFLDQAVLAHSDRSLSAVDAAKAKWWSAEVQNEVIDHCVQIFGGYGYMNEYRVARAWRDARVTKIWAGSNEIMKELIGRDLGFGRS